MKSRKIDRLLKRLVEQGQLNYPESAVLLLAVGLMAIELPDHPDWAWLKPALEGLTKTSEVPSE